MISCRLRPTAIPAETTKPPDTGGKVFRPDPADPSAEFLECLPEFVETDNGL